MRGQQTEADRIAELERDPQCSQFDAHRCLCAACGRWVHLSGRAHKIFNWRRHKKGCTLQKARGAITIIQSKSPQQPVQIDSHVTVKGREELEDGIRMDVDEEMDVEKQSSYAPSDDGYYEPPASPNTTRSTTSTRSSIIYNPPSNHRTTDKRYLQLPSITTFALSPTGSGASTSTSTPPLSSSDAASCSTTSDSGHSLISAWSQAQAYTQYSYSQPLPVASSQSQEQMGSWGRSSHRPRGASTSSFRSLPPLSASSSSSSSVAATMTGSPSLRSRYHSGSRGELTGSGTFIECEGCQTTLEINDWTSHKRSCRAYARNHTASSSSLPAATADSVYGRSYGHESYHHTHTRSPPAPILLPMITTTSPKPESYQHAGMHPPTIIPRLSVSPVLPGARDSARDRGRGVLSAGYGEGDAGVNADRASSFRSGIGSGDSGSVKEGDAIMSHHLHHDAYRHSPPRLSIDTSFSRSTGGGQGVVPAAEEGGGGGGKTTTLAARNDRSHHHTRLGDGHGREEYLHSHQYRSRGPYMPSQPHSGSASARIGSADSRYGNDSHSYAQLSSVGLPTDTGIRTSPRGPGSSAREGGGGAAHLNLNLSGTRGAHGEPHVHTHQHQQHRVHSHVEPKDTNGKCNSNSPTTSTSTRSGGLKIADLCHPGPSRSSISPTSPGGPDASERSRSLSRARGHRSRADSLSWSYSRSRSRSRSASRSRSYSDSRPQYTYVHPARPALRQHSSEDNSTTPTDTPLPPTSATGTILPRRYMRSEASSYSLSSYDSDHEGGSTISSGRQLQYSYSQSRSTFHLESDSEYGSEGRFGLPKRSLSPPSPYASDSDA